MAYVPSKTFLTLLALIPVGFAILFFGPETAAVRLDSGDICYSFCGIPVRYLKLPEPQRSQLLAIAATSPDHLDEWQWVPIDNLHGPDRMCFQEYRYITAFLSTDATLVRFMLEDNADYIRATHWQHGLPPTIALYHAILPVSTPLPTLTPDWRTYAAPYAAAHHYILPP